MKKIKSFLSLPDIFKKENEWKNGQWKRCDCDYLLIDWSSECRSRSRRRTSGGRSSRSRLMDNNLIVSLSRRIRHGRRRGFLGRRSRVLNRRPQVYHPIVPYNSLHPPTTTPDNNNNNIGKKGEGKEIPAGYQVQVREKWTGNKKRNREKKNKKLKKWKTKINKIIFSN